MIHQRVCARMHQKRYRQLWGHLSRFSSDTFESQTKSLRGNQYFQLFCNSGAFTKVYALWGDKELHLSLNRFLNEIGFPVSYILMLSTSIHWSRRFIYICTYIIYGQASCRYEWAWRYIICWTWPSSSHKKICNFVYCLFIYVRTVHIYSVDYLTMLWSWYNLRFGPFCHHYRTKFT